MNRASLLKRAAALVLAPSLLAKLPAPALAAEELAVTVPGPSTTFLSVAGATRYFKAHDILRNEITGENMLVTAIHPDGLEVERGMGTIKDVLPLPPAQTPKLPPAAPAPGNFAWLEDEFTPVYHPPYVRIANLST